MSPLKIGILATVLTAVILWLLGVPPAWLVLSVVAGAFAFISALRTRALGWSNVDLSTSAPRVDMTERPSIDLSDELADLLKSASQRANRLLEDSGTIDPFVIYEDRGGDVRIRVVDGTDPAATLARAREAARAIDATAPRLVAVVRGWADVKGRRKAVVIYEAAERDFSGRTLAFAQAYVPRRLRFISAHVVGWPVYIGDAPHTLRFRREAPAVPAAAPGLAAPAQQG